MTPSIAIYSSRFRHLLASNVNPARLADLADTFLTLVLRYRDEQNAKMLWHELVEAYSQPHRRYHTLAHLQHVLSHLVEVEQLFKDWDAALFALFYHDVVYRVSNKDNEERSAEFATSRLKSLHVSPDRIEICRLHILATKSHAENQNNDINLFTDADLSILGETWETYRNYCEQVRREYSIYPDLLYKPGRKKVLQHFLQMKTIFKTSFFASRFEQQARQNIAREIAELL